jgi:hypothetical protein
VNGAAPVITGNSGRIAIIAPQLLEIDNINMGLLLEIYNIQGLHG